MIPTEDFNAQRTDAAFRLLASLLENAKSLEALNMKGNVKFYERPYLKEFVEALPPTLKELDLGETAITDEFMEHIAVNCPRVETLNLSNCPQLCQPQLYLLKHLKRLHIVGCTSMQLLQSNAYCKI